MTVFHYTGRRLDGRFISGTLQVASANEALTRLRSASVCVTALEKSDTPRGRVASLVVWQPNRRRERLAFFQTMSVLVGAGIALRRSFDVAIEQCRSAAFKESLRAMSVDLDAGSAFHVALARRSADFSPTIVAMVKAGEIGGALEAVLGRIAQGLEREEALRKRLYGALTYPCIVAAGAAGLVVFLVASIVPAFSDLFSQMHEAMPPATRALTFAAALVREPVAWMALFATGAGTWVAWRSLRFAPRHLRAVQRWALRVPVVGNIGRNLALAQIGRVLGTLLWSGVPILQALDLCSEAIANVCYAEAMRRARNDLENGCSLTVAWNDAQLFPGTFAQFVRAGEEAGALDTMLLRAAQACELEAESALATLGTLVEPALIVILGAVVGTIVGSILIPLYSLIGGMK